MYKTLWVICFNEPDDHDPKPSPHQVYTRKTTIPTKYCNNCAPKFKKINQIGREYLRPFINCSYIYASCLKCRMKVQKTVSLPVLFYVRKICCPTIIITNNNSVALVHTRNLFPPKQYIYIYMLTGEENDDNYY
jgi:hypothetical protein